MTFKNSNLILIDIIEICELPSTRAINAGAQCLGY